MALAPRISLRLLLTGLCLLLGCAATAHAAPAFDPVAETEKYLASLPAEARAKSDAYFEGGYWLQLWQFLYGLAVLFAVLSLRWSARSAETSACV